MASFSAKMWGTIKSALASGEYASVIELHTALHKKYTNFPSIDAIKQKRFKKAADRQAIEKSIQEKNIDILARAGATREKAATTIAAMMDATKPCIITGYGKPKSAEEANGEPQGFATEIEDWQARDKAVTQFYKLTGDYTAEKQEPVIIDPIHIRVTYE